MTKIKQIISRVGQEIFDIFMYIKKTFIQTDDIIDALKGNKRRGRKKK